MNFIFDRQSLANIQPEEWVKWITSSQSVEELGVKYDKWAETYDASVGEVWAPIPLEAALMLSRHLDCKNTVLDVGVGTGLTGVSLAKLGFKRLIGMDLSAAMLEKAALKQVYTSLVCCAIGGTEFGNLPKVKGMIATGLFAEAQAGASELQILQEHLEPAGVLVFTARESFLPTIQMILDLPEWVCLESKMMGIYEDPMHLFAYKIHRST